MTTITSKRHKQNFYLAAILIFVAMAGIGTGLLVGFLTHLQPGKPEQYIIPVFSAVFYFTAVYAVYKYYKDYPIIQLDKNFISFNKETIALADLTHVELKGKHYFPFMGYRMEAAILTFKDGQTKYIFDDMYENSWELKSFLKQVVINKKEFVAQEIKSIESPNLDTEFHEVYNGNQITSFDGILLWGSIGFCVSLFFLVKKQPSIGVIITISLFCLVMFFLFSWLMHYFKVSQDYFIIKNHNLFWKTKAYRVADIDEIVFERRRMPNCLRVITKDFKSKLYPAGTLRNKTWLEMKDRLESLGLTVRNECI